jgi:oxygen-dependent protoporphyrinogen oxidase
MRVVVVGGGITGLCAAARLLDQDIDVVVLEAEDRAGGHARTHEEDGFRVEAGPDGYLDREPVLRERIARLGITSRVITARAEAKHRFVFRRGRMRRVPDSPVALLTTDALSIAGRLRVLAEPWARSAPAGVEETVHDFARRRIGGEAADALVDPAIAGISAGDSRALSVAASFPAMVEMERKHGSLIRAMAKQKGPRIALASFDGGMATLVDALRARLGPALRLGAPVRAVERDGRAWRVVLERGESLGADRVVLATPAHRAAPLVRALDAELARALGAIPFAGVAVVALAYRAAEISPLSGYGVLVDREAARDTLGVVWESSVFEGRAPSGLVLVRAMLGGARRPDVVEHPEAELVERARRDLEHVMGVGAVPLRSWVWRWPSAIAQYTIGHRERVAAIRARAAIHPGLELAGTSYDGVAFTSGARSGHDAADRVLRASWSESAASAALPPSESTSRPPRREPAAQRARIV